MNIFKARVELPKTFSGPNPTPIPRTADGTFYARLLYDKHEPTQNDDLIIVTYTSPMFKVGVNGIIAIPSEGASILVVKVDDEYFYLSTIARVDEGSKASLFGETKAYTDDTPIPRVQTFKNELGSGVTINSKFTKDKIVDNVVVKSGAKQSIIMDNGNNILQISNDKANISLGGTFMDKTKDLSAGEVKISTAGTVTLNSHNRSINMRVGPGGHEIDITNSAMPFPAPPSPIPAPGGNLNTIIPLFKTGNVNIRSEYNNINIKTGPLSMGGIFIETRFGSIMITELGKMRVNCKSPLGVDITSVGPINLDSLVSVSIGAPLINIHGTTTNIGPAGASINGVIPTAVFPHPPISHGEVSHPEFPAITGVAGRPSLPPIIIPAIVPYVDISDPDMPITP